MIYYQISTNQYDNKKIEYSILNSIQKENKVVIINNWFIYLQKPLTPNQSLQYCNEICYCNDLLVFDNDYVSFIDIENILVGYSHDWIWFYCNINYADQVVFTLLMLQILKLFFPVQTAISQLKDGLLFVNPTNALQRWHLVDLRDRSCHIKDWCESYCLYLHWSQPYHCEYCVWHKTTENIFDKLIYCYSSLCKMYVLIQCDSISLYRSKNLHECKK